MTDCFGRRIQRVDAVFWLVVCTLVTVLVRSGVDHSLDRRIPSPRDVASHKCRMFDSSCRLSGTQMGIPQCGMFVKSLSVLWTMRERIEGSAVRVACDGLEAKASK
jgi:hypothetical protein